MNNIKKLTYLFFSFFIRKQLKLLYFILQDKHRLDILTSNFGDLEFIDTMSNFFQSAIRKDIKTIVYNESHFMISLFDKEYFWLIKKKNIWPIWLSWYQVMGLEVPTHNPQRIAQEVQKIQRDYGNTRKNIFFQRWITNEILRFYNISHRSWEFAPGMRTTRLRLEERLEQETGLIKSFRENMPLATIIIDTSKDNETLLKEMNSGAKQHVRKSLNQDVIFETASPEDYNTFYEERHKVSGFKWFNIIPKDIYIRLMNYLTENKCGNIYLAKKDGVILWWSIAVFEWDTITYLYGFSNRNEKYRNIGVHQFIKFQMFQRARDNNIQYMDLFGWAPTWFPEHPLSSVSKFKESLGGTKIEWYWNFDIVLQPTLYNIFKQYHQWRR